MTEQPFRFLQLQNSSIEIRNNGKIAEMSNSFRPLPFNSLPCQTIYFTKSMRRGDILCLKVLRLYDIDDFCTMTFGVTTCLLENVTSQGNCSSETCDHQTAATIVDHDHPSFHIGDRVTFERHADGHIFHSVNDNQARSARFWSSDYRPRRLIDYSANTSLTPFIELQYVTRMKIVDEPSPRTLSEAVVAAVGTALASLSARERTLSLPPPSGASLPIFQNFRFKLMGHDDVRIRRDRKAAKRLRDECSSNFIYLTRAMKRGDRLTFRVNTVDSELFETSFVFGVTTCSQENLEDADDHVRETCQRGLCGGHSLKFRIFGANNSGDMVMFERRQNGHIYATVNCGNEIEFNLPQQRYLSFKDVAELTPFVHLNGFVYEIVILDSRNGLNREDDRQSRSLVSRASDYSTSTNWITTSNVAMIDKSLIVLFGHGLGRALNQQPFKPNTQITFKIRDVKAINGLDTLSFALAEPSRLHFEGESLDNAILADALTIMSNIVSNPAPGLVCTLYRKGNGEVTVHFREETRTLFRVHSEKDFWPMLVFTGSVKSIELVPSDPHNVQAPFEQFQAPEASGGAQPLLPEHGRGQSRASSDTNSSPRQSDMSAAQSSKECSICMEKPVDCAIITCGHQKTCMDCAERIVSQGDGRCPICRGLIESLLKVYPD